MTALPVPGDQPEAPWTMGDRIWKIRKELHIGQLEFGAFFGVGESTVSKWENDDRTPRKPLETIPQMAAIAQERGLNWVTTEWILGLGTPPGTRTQNLQIKSPGVQLRLVEGEGGEPDPFTLVSDDCMHDAGSYLPLPALTRMFQPGGVLSRGTLAA